MIPTFTSESLVVMFAVAPKPRDGVLLLGVGPMLDEEAVQTSLTELELGSGVAEVGPGELVSVLVLGVTDELEDPPVLGGFAVGCATPGASGPQALSNIMRPAAAAAAVVP